LAIAWETLVMSIREFCDLPKGVNYQQYV
jgi:hypothetical protein